MEGEPRERNLLRKLFRRTVDWYTIHSFCTTCCHYHCDDFHYHCTRASPQRKKASIISRLVHFLRFLFFNIVINTSVATIAKAWPQRKTQWVLSSCTVDQSTDIFIYSLLSSEKHFPHGGAVLCASDGDTKSMFMLLYWLQAIWDTTRRSFDEPCKAVNACRPILEFDLRE